MIRINLDRFLRFCWRLKTAAAIVNACERLLPWSFCGWSAPTRHGEADQEAIKLANATSTAPRPTPVSSRLRKHGPRSASAPNGPKPTSTPHEPSISDSRSNSTRQPPTPTGTPAQPTTHHHALAAPPATQRPEPRRHEARSCLRFRGLELPQSGDQLGTTRHALYQTTRMWLNAVPDSSSRLSTL